MIASFYQKLVVSVYFVTGDFLREIGDSSFDDTHAFINKMCE